MPTVKERKCASGSEHARNGKSASIVCVRVHRGDADSKANHREQVTRVRYRRMAAVFAYKRQNLTCQSRTCHALWHHFMWRDGFKWGTAECAECWLRLKIGWVEFGVSGRRRNRTIYQGDKTVQWVFRKYAKLSAWVVIGDSAWKSCRVSSHGSGLVVELL
ncbi:hypothetical protein FVE85_9747 [Porphyridium purpureum]|uniref:Uncharacterized protein n=1 Tax=Porphyridium purpureum TaxID=35688 RepID=A0A5J4YLC8_PORPP|nr:hypothetical protein FVE85_9747 [Porphyridium purpureum]|eukprot:POR6337..scf246_12